MPLPNYLQPSYMGAMDQSSYFATIDAFGPTYSPTHTDEGLNSGLGPLQLGMTNNPMQNQLQALQAKIREGASKIEFEFAGKQKGSSQASTPESYGRDERQMMRELAQLNDMKTSTHATFSVSGLAGFGQRGFSKQQQYQTIHEVERAIDFAKDATTGGAIVVHTGEWERPVGHYYNKKDSKWKFEQFEGEVDEQQLIAVDGETGEFINIVKKEPVVVPHWQTAADYFENTTPIKGKMRSGEETLLKPTDLVDSQGRKLDMETKNSLDKFYRVPVQEANIEEGFKTDVISWDDIQKRVADHNEEFPNDKISEEVYVARLQLDNQILQQRGSSAYYRTGYEGLIEETQKLEEAYEFYKNLEGKMSPQELENMMIQKNFGEFIPPGKQNISDFLKQRRDQNQLRILHAHEASASADAQASNLQQRRERITTVQDYGMKQSAQALSKLGRQAMEATRIAKQERRADERFDDLYIAPENWHPSQYGSHPEELFELIKSGREQMAKDLVKNNDAHDIKQAREMAKKHIKTTLDIGHFNMWRNMMKKREDIKETDEQFQERFNDWITTHLEKFHKEGMIGHLHLTDNFGFNDEHLSIGQGNAPVKEFVKWMKEKGHTDFIIEPGSFNPATIMPDAWSYLGAVNWKRHGPSFSNIHAAHSAMYAPPNYIVGAYVPSNEWTLWSGVPLE